jgi:Cytochrome P450
VHALQALQASFCTLQLLRQPLLLQIGFFWGESAVSERVLLFQCSEFQRPSVSKCSNRLQAVQKQGDTEFNPEQWLKAGQGDAVAADVTMEGGCPASQAAAAAAGGCPMHAFDSQRAQPMRGLIFGNGPRTCSGKHLAMMEVAVGLIALAREVQHIDMSEQDKGVSFSPTFTPPGSMPVTFTPRSA